MIHSIRDMEVVPANTKLLSLDWGTETGLVWAEKRDNHWWVTEHKTEFVAHTFVHLQNNPPINTIVLMETPPSHPIGQSRAAYDLLSFLLNLMNVDIVLIPPSQWKRAVKIRRVPTFSRHEMSALGVLIFALRVWGEPDEVQLCL